MPGAPPGGAARRDGTRRGPSEGSGTPTRAGGFRPGRTEPDPPCRRGSGRRSGLAPDFGHELVRLSRRCAAGPTPGLRCGLTASTYMHEGARQRGVPQGCPARRPDPGPGSGRKGPSRPDPPSPGFLRGQRTGRPSSGFPRGRPPGRTPGPGPAGLPQDLPWDGRPTGPRGPGRMAFLRISLWSAIRTPTPGGDPPAS